MKCTGYTHTKCHRVDQTATVTMSAQTPCATSENNAAKAHITQTEEHAAKGHNRPLEATSQQSNTKHVQYCMAQLKHITLPVCLSCYSRNTSVVFY